MSRTQWVRCCDTPTEVLAVSRRPRATPRPEACACVGPAGLRGWLVRAWVRHTAPTCRVLAAAEGTGHPCLSQYARSSPSRSVGPAPERRGCGCRRTAGARAPERYVVVRGACVAAGCLTSRQGGSSRYACQRKPHNHTNNQHRTSRARTHARASFPPASLFSTHGATISPHSLLILILCRLPCAKINLK